MPQEQGSERKDNEKVTESRNFKHAQNKTSNKETIGDKFTRLMTFNQQIQKQQEDFMRNHNANYPKSNGGLLRSSTPGVK